MQEISLRYIKLDEVPLKMPHAYWRNLVLEFQHSGAEACEVSGMDPEKINNNRIGIYKQIKKLGFSDTLGATIRDGKLYLYRKGDV